MFECKIRGKLAAESAGKVDPIDSQTRHVRIIRSLYRSAPGRWDSIELHLACTEQQVVRRVADKGPETRLQWRRSDVTFRLE